MASALTVMWRERLRDDVEVVRIAWAIEVIDRDRRVPFVRPALLAGDMQPAVDIAHFEHLILQKHFLAIPIA
jgi:hypothetical protein